MRRLARTFTRVRFPGTHELRGIVLIHCEGSGNEDEENLSSTSLKSNRKDTKSPQKEVWEKVRNT